MQTPLDVYVFRDDHFAPAGSTVVCAADKNRVDALLGHAQVDATFSGAAIYTNDATKQDFIGVWGARNAPKFRRLLREHGAEIVVHQSPPPNARLRYWNTHTTRKRRSRRLTADPTGSS
jgi:hypothetical protein